MNEGPLKSTLKQLLDKLQDPEQARRASLIDCWPEIVGRNFSKHTKARFIQGEKVAVWVDDSTLAFELSQRYKPTILKRLQNQFGAEKIKDVRFVVGEIR